MSKPEKVSDVDYATMEDYCKTEPQNLHTNYCQPPKDCSAKGTQAGKKAWRDFNLKVGTELCTKVAGIDAIVAERSIEPQLTPCDDAFNEALASYVSEQVTKVADSCAKEPRTELAPPVEVETVKQLAQVQDLQQQMQTLQQQVKELQSNPKIAEKKLFNPSITLSTGFGDVSITNSCQGPERPMNVTVPGWYIIRFATDIYLYSGNYNDVTASVWEYATKRTVCLSTENLPASAEHGYMKPFATCIEHLNAGIYIFTVGGSNAMNCATSSINKINGASANMVLMLAD